MYFKCSITHNVACQIFYKYEAEQQKLRSGRNHWHEVQKVMISYASDMVRESDEVIRVNHKIHEHTRHVL